jgi:hypothetical protein
MKAWAPASGSSGSLGQQARAEFRWRPGAARGFVRLRTMGGRRGPDRARRGPGKIRRAAAGRLPYSFSLIVQVRDGWLSQSYCRAVTLFSVLTPPAIVRHLLVCTFLI